MKKTIAVIVSALAISLTNVSNAQTDTYTFTGDTASGYYPANEIDGSTITISGGSTPVLTDWSFTAIGLGTFATPADSSIVTEDITSYNSSGWTGQIDLSYSYIDIDVTGSSFTSVALDSSIQGTWTTPDGASTFGLLSAALGGLGICRRFLRR